MTGNRFTTRRRLGITKEDHVPTAEILSKLGETLLSDKVKKRRWGYLGHIARYPGDRWVRKMLTAKSEGKTKPGEGAKSTWSKDMENERVKRKLSLVDAKNRSKWANKSELSPTTIVEQEGGSEEENINVTTTNLTIQQISRLQGRRRNCVGKS